MEDPNYCLWIIASPCHPLDWWAAGAAWAQAALTVGTVALANLTASRQREADIGDRDRKEAEKAKSFAVIVLREMKEICDRLQTAIERAEESIEYKCDLQVETPKIPQSLWNNTEKMHILGAASNPIINCIYRVLESREHFLDGVSHIPNDEVESYLAYIRDAHSSAVDAIKQLREILD